LSHRGLKIADFLIDGLAVFVADRAGTRRTPEDRTCLRPPCGVSRAVFGEIRHVGLHHHHLLGRAPFLESSEAILDVSGIGWLALFAVIDYVDAGLDLLSHDFRDGRWHTCLERRDIATTSLDRRGLSQQIGGPRQAARMGSQDAFRAALHFAPSGLYCVQ